MPNDKPLVICLTPVKNEAWILHRFLACVSLWADHIIIADQDSTDNSVEIAKRFDKVQIIHNSSPFDERIRQKLLLDAARKIPGKKLLIALDADEFFSANILASAEWQHILQSSPGTCIRVQWVQPLPRFVNVARDPRIQYFIGYMDDGAEFQQSRAIHNSRLPIPNNSHQLFLNDIVLLHYNLVDAHRDSSKKCWYMCWELLNNKASPFYINRGYVHHHVLDDPEPFRKEWIDAYEQKSIDMTSVSKFAEFINFEEYGKSNWNFEPIYWWDEDILAWMKQYGAKKFAKLDIWGKEWDILGKRKFGNDTNFKRRTSIPAKIIIRYIRSTPNYRKKFFIRKLDKLIAPLFDSRLM